MWLLDKQMLNSMGPGILRVILRICLQQKVKFLTCLQDRKGFQKRYLLRLRFCQHLSRGFGAVPSD